MPVRTGDQKAQQQRLRGLYDTCETRNSRPNAAACGNVFSAAMMMARFSPPMQVSMVGYSSRSARPAEMDATAPEATPRRFLHQHCAVATKRVGFVSQQYLQQRVEEISARGSARYRTTQRCRMNRTGTERRQPAGQQPATGSMNAGIFSSGSHHYAKADTITPIFLRGRLPDIARRDDRHTGKETSIANQREGGVFKG